MKLAIEQFVKNRSVKRDGRQYHTKHMLRPKTLIRDVFEEIKLQGEIEKALLAVVCNKSERQIQLTVNTLIKRGFPISKIFADDGVVYKYDGK